MPCRPPSAEPVRPDAVGCSGERMAVRWPAAAVAAALGGESERPNVRTAADCVVSTSFARGRAGERAAFAASAASTRSRTAANCSRIAGVGCVTPPCAPHVHSGAGTSSSRAVLAWLSQSSEQHARHLGPVGHRHAAFVLRSHGPYTPEPPSTQSLLSTPLQPRAPVPNPRSVTGRPDTGSYDRGATTNETPNRSL